jgi:serine phosphatase RsbU (regulator of sigma subunit)/anti-sigma regulatory factor (Ser/Thr protein kinase)
MQGADAVVRARQLWSAWLDRRRVTVLPKGPHDAETNLSPIADALDLDPDDPLVARLKEIPGTTDVAKLGVESPLVRQLCDRGIVLVVPMVSQGEVVGLLGLGPRRGRQAYSDGDRALLTGLAAQAAPVLRVAQMVRQRQAEAQERERIEQELQVAQLIQQTLMPKTLPELPGWILAAVYRPARAIGGDFYDFVTLADGRVGIIIADVTSKGVPAALVMATTRSVLRTSALQEETPGNALGRANELICPDMPPNMFVSCFYAILDPESGILSFANAGHPLALRRHNDGVDELRATGLPLGLMLDARYEEREIVVSPCETILFYSDGLVEAHDSTRGEMLGVPRLKRLIAEHQNGQSGLIDHVMEHFRRFTGPHWEAEDDVTLLSLQRVLGDKQPTEVIAVGDPSAMGVHQGDEWRTLDEWDVASELGNERTAMERAAAAVRPLGLSPRRIERLKTAIAEATLNAMEHGNGYRSNVFVHLEVRASDNTVSVRVTDQGGGGELDTQPPDIEAKLQGRQSPRGWGLFLIKEMVDQMDISIDREHHTVELLLRLRGENDASEEA